MAEKYEDYFKEWNADIAIGRKGPHFFYVYDEKGEEFETFCTFKTAGELERLIVATLAQNLCCINSAGTESLSMEIEKAEMEACISEFNPDYHIALLARQMEAIHKEYGNWKEMMEQTYRSLRHIMERMG